MSSVEGLFDREETDQTNLDFDEYDEATKKRKVLYVLGADATCEFKNEKFIRVNRTVLALQSKFFMDSSFGLQSVTILKIEDFNHDTFEIFLDCLFGLKEYSVSDALVIYPIARKYEVKKSMKRCISVLKPKEMNENVCLTLNLAVEHECEELMGDVISFIENEVGIINFMENYEYCSFLQPKAMCKLIEKIWEIIYDWAKNYWDKPEDYNGTFWFLKENRILEKFSLSHFESIQSIFDFHKKTNKKLVGADEMFEFLEENLKKRNDEKLPEKSSWKDVKTGEIVEEILVFKNSYWVSSEDAKNGLLLEIWTNRMDVKNPKNNDCDVVQYKIRYFGRNVSSDKTIGTMKQLTNGKDDKEEKTIALPSKATFNFGAPKNPSAVSPHLERKKHHPRSPIAKLKKNGWAPGENSPFFEFYSGKSASPQAKPSDSPMNLNSFSFASIKSPASEIKEEDTSKALVPCGNDNSIISKSSEVEFPLESTDAPTFSFKAVYAVAEKSNNPNMKKLSASILQPKTFLEIKSVEITYTFLGSCKILKTSINDCFDNAGQLYFTRNVVCSPKL